MPAPVCSALNVIFNVKEGTLYILITSEPSSPTASHLPFLLNLAVKTFPEYVADHTVLEVAKLMTLTLFAADPVTMKLLSGDQSISKIYELVI